MTPVLAIVGRPNVGKSTLFNRLVGKQAAIVHDEPGVTRDRHYGDAMIGGRHVLVVDTGGFDPDSDDPMKQGIKRQIDIAIGEADVIVCVLDATQAVTGADQAETTLLRRSSKPVVWVANKADSPRQEVEAMDLYRLGVDQLLVASALHGRGIAELEAAIVAALPPDVPEPSAVTEAAIRVAILGRPNAGKSSLVNRLAGKERQLVDARPGTTRDAIDVLVERGGSRFLLIDTAGIRRKAKVGKDKSVVEAESILRAIKAIDRAEVVVLLVDGSEGIADQDAKILSLSVDRNRGVVVALNKIDLLDERGLAAAEQAVRDAFVFAPWIPTARLSAKTGRGTTALLEAVTRVAGSYRQRIPTAELNRFFEQVLAAHPPPTRGGRAPRLYFITQAESNPPLFVAMASDPEKIHPAYRRYVENQLRKAFGFEGVPLRVKYKARRRRGSPA